MARPYKKLNVGSACDIGRKRRGKENQDALEVMLPRLFNRRPPLLLVADGMGGHEGGEIASKLVIKSFMSEYRKTRSFDDPLSVLKNCVDVAHRAVQTRAQSNPELEAMGSTIVAACIVRAELYTANVGDSRAYVVRDNEISQLSVDHSWVEEQVLNGVLTPQEAKEHPWRSRLTQSISAKRSNVEPELKVHTLLPEDIIILCSDGLWGMVPNTLIRSVMTQLPPQEAADKLVELANAHKGADNISVIIARDSTFIPSEESMEAINDLDETDAGV